MKKRTLTVTNWLLVTIIGALGFSSCKKPSNPGDDDIRTMYGVPYASYSIKGKVLDNLQKPISGIKVEIQVYKDQQYSIIQPMSAITDSKGEFAKTFNNYPINFELDLKYIDIDGIANGLFKTEEQKIAVKTSDVTGKPNGWNVGTVQKETAVTLENDVQ